VVYDAINSPFSAFGKRTKFGSFLRTRVVSPTAI
jgi:hypothetical protein